MKRYDFAVRYDPERDTETDIAKRILYNVIVKNRLKQDKQTIMFIGGDSGEGKSITALSVEGILLDVQNIRLEDVLDDTNVFVPIEYPKKIDKLLFPKERKELKKVNVLAIHEAREVIKAKMWANFLTQAIADVNAMSRAIKPLCLIIVSQFIRDITTDVRYTLTFYCTVRRPARRHAQLSIWVMWKDDRDLEKPKLRKRRLIGFLIDPKGRYRLFKPKYFEMGKPPKEIVDRFKELDFNSKSGIIRNKLDRLIKEMEMEMNVGNNKIAAMIGYYTKNMDLLRFIGKQTTKGAWKIKKEVMEMHDLTPTELKEFEKALNTKIADFNKKLLRNENADIGDEDGVE